MTATHWPAGSLPATYQPGDFFVVKDWKEDLLGHIIEDGQRAEYGNVDFSRWTHSGGIVTADGDICEANANGIDRDSIEKYRDSDIMVVTPGAPRSQRALCVAFWLSHVGDKYDYSDYVGLTLDAMFGIDTSLHSGNRFICSAFVARGTEKYIVSYPHTIEAMKPANLVEYWDQESGQPAVQLTLFDRLLLLLTLPRHLLKGHAARGPL
jgi:hypothetical protein